jgi:hypothetical protein
LISIRGTYSSTTPCWTRWLICVLVSIRTRRSSSRRQGQKTLTPARYRSTPSRSR